MPVNLTTNIKTQGPRGLSFPGSFTFLDSKCVSDLYLIKTRSFIW